MNKYLFISVLALMATTCVSYYSCSDDEDNNQNGSDNESSSIVVGPSNVFSELTPKSVMGARITYNSNGQVSKIITEDGGILDFTYGNGITSRAADDNRTVKVVYMEDNEKYTFNMKIGNNGFVQYCEEIEPDGDLETWEFGYNTDNQLNYMKRSEGGNEITNITYVDGNITKVSMYSEEDGNGSEFTIKYTSKEIPTMIENKGCIMLFDQTFGIDMDEFAYIYYAGLLGKATKNLPVQTFEQSMLDYQNWLENFTWELNSDGYPVKMSTEWDSYSFAW